MSIQAHKLNFNRFSYLFALLTTTPFWGAICLLQVLSGLASFIGLPLLVPVLEMMQGSNASVSSNQYIRFLQPVFDGFHIKPDFNHMLFLAAALMLLGQLLVNASSLVCTFVKEDLLKAYRIDIFKHYALVDWQWLTEHHSARMYHAVIKEAEQACEAHMNAQRVLINIFQIGVYLLISLRLSWQITVIAAGVYLVIGVFNAINLKFIQQFSEDVNQRFKQFSNDTVSFQHNKKFIKVAMLADIFLKAFNKSIIAICQLRKRQMLHVELQRAGNMLSTSILLIVLIFFHQALALNYATLLLVLFVFMRLTPQFVALADTYAALDMSIPMHQSLQEHIRALEQHREKNGVRLFEKGNDIRFDNVQFAYPKQPLLFTRLSLTISPNSMIALVGKSGCGKSTILDLLLGLLTPTAGVIHYGQVPHDELDKDHFRRQIAVVGQRPSLLDGTILENLMMANPLASLAAVKDVCQRVHLEDFIKSLPEGLDTIVGENGIKLSGGQRQRIALARCLLVEPSILILDEATSELDAAAESVIQETLHQLRHRMTIIVVAHRLSTVKAADKIFVIEEGGVCESGSYEELMGSKGKFYSFIQYQH